MPEKNKHNQQNKEVVKPPFANPSGPDAIKESVAEAVEKAKKSDTIVIKSSVKKEDEKVDLFVKLTNKYEFEGKTYETLDLSGVTDLGTEDMGAIEKMYFSGGNFAPICEMSMPFTIMVAARGCNMPVELLNNLKANDAVKVKNAVSGFLLS